jgi:hypothetical protein
MVNLRIRGWMPASAIAACLLLGACASAPARQPVEPEPESEPAPATVATLFEPRAPTHALDIVPRGVPPRLLELRDYPYARPQPLDCQSIALEVQQLDALLGPDLDDPAGPASGDHTFARLLIGGMRSAIPYFGWLRRLTGVERREQLALEAITAGDTRRGYLKGLGDAMHCAPPAAPHPMPTPASAADASPTGCSETLKSAPVARITAEYAVMGKPRKVRRS